MKKRNILILMCILILFIAGCSQKKSDADIAEVNGEKVKQSEFDQRFAMIKANYEDQKGEALDEEKDKELIDNIKNSAFDDLIMQKLIHQEAKKQDIKVSSEEIDIVFNNFKQSLNSSGTDGYQKFLEKTKITEKELRSEIETSQLYQKLQDKVTASIKVNDAEAQTYYNENKETFKDPGGMQIYHILVDSEQKATEVINKIKQGGDFAGLAKEYSTDTGSKDQGGDVGLVNESTNFVTEFKQAALALQPGQLSPQPVKSEFGYHIIKAGDKKPAKQLSFDEVKAQLIQQIETDQKDKAFNTYLEDLKNKADIKDLRKK